MKKFRSTLILIIIGIGFLFYIKFFDDRFAGTEDLPQTTALDRAGLDAFSIRNSEGVIEFKRTDGVWNVESPVKDRADDEALTALFTTLEGLDLDLRRVALQKGRDTKEVLKELGLTKGEVSIKLAGKKNMELLVGKDSAVEGRVYARIEGSDMPYVMSAELRKQIAKGVKDWRDRKLIGVSTAEITKVVLKTAKGEIEAERKNANWSLVRPLKARADNQKIGDLIASATAPRIEDFLSDVKDLSSFGLTEPRAVISLHVEGTREPIVLQIGGVKDVKRNDKKDGADEKGATASVYAKASTREGVVLVPASIESLILTQPNDLRDTRLIRVQQDIVDRITLESGGSKIVIGRSGEDWKRKVDGKPDEPINSPAANKLLNDLTNAKSIRFVEDVGSDLKRYGLDQPSAAATLSSYSTEGTPESSPGDKPIARVVFGREENGLVFAKLDDEPFIVAVNKSLTEALWADPLQWQDLKVYDFNRNDVVKIDVTRPGQPAVSFALDKEKAWRLAKGDGEVNQAAVQSMVNTLSGLRAVRWAGKSKLAEHGLDKPSVVVQFAMADGKVGKLSVGSANAELLRHATAEGKAGTFLMNAPDVTALEAVFVETQKASSSQSVNPAPSATEKPIEPLSPIMPAPGGDLKETQPPKTQEAPAAGAKPATDSGQP
jgi:hypothetical protein